MNNPSNQAKIKTNDNHTEEDPSEIIIVEGKFNDKKVILPFSLTSQQLFDKNYFGTQLPDKQLELEIVEALLLIERSRLKVFNVQNQEMTAEQILALYSKHDEKIWVKYLVYRDIRQRGYIVRTGYGEGIDFRVYPRGSSRTVGVAKYFIFILDEENPVHLQKLDKITQQTLNSRKELILAIVDRLGDPTYYQLEQFQLKENTKKEKFW
ncbi:hypothetical protein NEF87_000659 [Candidatus Lokiarchaeum ossiferum]|uniref:tRNA-intron lyase n=1 Tax=Candidatus Lokiarchaeum ossiferum TaxID=2951803 RepID=A0ABY6HP93_9ARCH|nr:hypothetical protein NEF87_000659 [Candidatus Lokiarchaeum sp. B-35]